MKTGEILPGLEGFLPHLVRRSGAASLASTTEASAEQLSGALFFADVSGFTSVADRLAKAGASGADELSQRLNAYVGALLDHIEDHGGKVLRFAGDGITALWEAELNGLSDATTAAARCALALHAPVEPRNDPIAAFTIKVGVATGPLRALHLGGVDDQWVAIAAGTPIREMHEAERHAGPGQVVLAKSAKTALGDAAAGSSLPGGHFLLTAIRAWHQGCPVSRKASGTAPQTMSRLYVPPGVWRRLQAGQGEWLAELRRETVLFVKVSDLDPGEVDALGTCQEVVRLTQQTLKQYGGDLISVSAETASLWLLAVFGLPAMAHGDDAVRGVRAGMQLHALLAQKQYSTSIGIATGHVISGPVGNDSCREYTVIGDTVNLAARFAQTVHNDLVCDGPTAHGAGTKIDFDLLPPLVVKGKSAPVATYRPVGRRTVLLPAAPEPVGRESEQAAYRARLDRLAANKGGAVLIIGEAGMGKSCLLADLAATARLRGLRLARGECDAIEDVTPLYPWRQVLRDVLSPEGDLDDGALAREADALLARAPDLQRWSPLLNALLPTAYPATAFTEELPGDARAAILRNLVLHLIREAAVAQPLVILIEDVHWMDWLSWDLAEAAARTLPNVLLVASLRRLMTPRPAAYDAMRDAGHTLTLELHPLDLGATEKLMQQLLKVDLVAPAAAHYLFSRAGGHPYFSVQLAQALVEAGALLCDHGICRLPDDASKLESLSLPATIEGAITSQIDQLQPREQMCLKVASIFGGAFPLHLFEQVYPVTSDVPALRPAIEQLCTAGFLQPDTGKGAEVYEFRHALIRDGAYATMPRAQRRILHRSAAGALEAANEDRLTQASAILAHHWSAAEEWPAAVRFLDMAGENALKNYANHEAINFFARAQRICELMSGQHAEQPLSDLVQRARRERLTAQAYHNAGSLDESIEHLHQGLAILGHPQPKRVLPLLAGTLAAAVQQAFHYHMPVFARRGGKRDAAYHEAALACELLSLAAFFRNDALSSVHAVFRSVQLAEHVRDQHLVAAVLARSYASLGSLFGTFMQWHDLADTYSARAAVLAKENGATLAYAWVEHVAGYYKSNFGMWEQVLEKLAVALEVYEDYGDRRRWEEAAYTLAMAEYLRGNFDKAQAMAEAQLVSAEQRVDINSRALARCMVAMVLLARGGLNRAVELLDPVLAAPDGEVGGAVRAHAHGLSAEIAMRRGELDRAREIAERVCREFPAGLSNPLDIAGLSRAVEILLYLDVLQRQAARPNAATSRLTTRTLRRLRRAIRTAPVYESLYLYSKGMEACAAGDLQHAMKHWRNSVDAARRYRVPYDEARALAQLANCAAVNEAERRDCLDCAATIFQRLGTAYDAEALRRYRVALAE